MKREDFKIDARGEVDAVLKDLFGGIHSASEIEELQEGALLMEEWSKTDCFCKPVGGMEEWAKETGSAEAPEKLCCDWYHGTWQYMHSLNMVAVPRWYPFYKGSLGEVLRRKPKARVMISACADYGMLQTLHDAIRETKANPTIIIYDICNTPLKSSQWYADRHNLAVECFCENIITADIEKASFDLITTDEFFTVLQDSYKPLIVEKWMKILKPDGVVVTTAMIGKPTTRELRNGYAKRAEKLFEAHGKLMFPYHADSDEMIRKLHDRFLKFAMFHTRHMIKDENQVKNLLKGFKYLSIDRLTTPGECVTPTDSFQITARLGD